MAENDPVSTPPAPAVPPAEVWTPPSRDEVERMQAALAKANAEQKAAREEALRKAREAGASDAEKAARLAADQAAEAKWSPLLVDKAAAAALAAADGIEPARLVQLLDRSKLSVDDKGNVIGLEGEVAAVKKAWPELFRKQVPTAGQVAAPNVAAGPPGKKSSAGRLADLMRGNT